MPSSTTDPCQGPFAIGIDHAAGLIPGDAIGLIIHEGALTAVSRNRRVAIVEADELALARITSCIGRAWAFTGMVTEKAERADVGIVRGYPPK